jgi:protocatechuate 3,4-dioxygenase beta subunit
MTQQDIDRQITGLRGSRPGADHPARAYPPYRSSALRHPKRPLTVVDDPDAVEPSGPVFGITDVTDSDRDLTRQHHGEPLGERISVSGRVLDRTGRPVTGQLVEIWQAEVRRAVLGGEHVDRAAAATTGFTADFQDLITRYAWGEIWTRPGLDRQTSWLGYGDLKGRREENAQICESVQASPWRAVSR